MPIKELISDSNPMNITHECKVLHIDGHPIACVIDKNQQNKQKYKSFSGNLNLQANLDPIVGESIDFGWIMILTINLRILDDKLTFTISPDDEFIDILINNSEIVVVDDFKKPLFAFGLKDISRVIELKQKLFELRQD